MRVTIAIPCLDEAPTIGGVVRDFRETQPDAEIIVFDNASTDGSADLARAAGARVIREKRRGKGYVMQSIFENVDADICVIVDGDATYSASDLPALLEPVIADRADMVVGERLTGASKHALTDLHRFGNRAIIGIINLVFRTEYRDVLSGYRVLNRAFLQSVPLITTGFETETELTLQALEKGMVVVEVPIEYRARPEGSHSKLNAFADGYRILITMAVLLRNHRPLYFFSVAAVGLLLVDTAYLASWGGGWLPAWDIWIHWAFVAGSVGLAGALVVFGVVLNAVNTGMRELIALSRRPGRQ